MRFMRQTKSGVIGGIPMRDEKFKALAELPSPVLTLYLNTMSANKSHHPLLSLSRGWLRKKAALIAQNLPSKDAKAFEHDVVRIEKFLKDYRPSEKALLMIAGTKTWNVFPLRFLVENSLYWGEPSLGQLIRLSNTHKPCGVVVLDHQRARFFAHATDEFNLLVENTFDIDSSQWKNKDLGHVASERIRKTRGSQRDLFDDRMDAQYDRVCRETADAAASLAVQHGFATIFLVGPDRMTGPVKAKLPARLSERAVLVSEDLGNFSKRDLLLRLRPIIEDSERARQLAAVTQLLQADAGVVVNIDEALSHLQNGTIASLLVARNFELSLHRCRKCGLASRSADPVCGACGGTLDQTTFSELLSFWILTHGVNIEFVQGPAADRLQSAGGIGGWLRKVRVAAR
jgi:protein required for attachment to host cells